MKFCFVLSKVIGIVLQNRFVFAACRRE